MKKYITWKTTGGTILLLGALFAIGYFTFSEEEKQLRDPKTFEVTIKSKGFSFAMEPEEVSVLQGDTVRWKLATEKGSYKIAFEDVPEGARDVLAEQNKLESPELTEKGDQWSLTITSEFPPGKYHYISPEQQDVGLEGWITVEPRS